MHGLSGLVELLVRLYEDVRLESNLDSIHDVLLVTPPSCPGVQRHRLELERIGDVELAGGQSVRVRDQIE